MQIINWNKVDYADGFIEHAYDYNGIDYLYQIVPNIVKGLDLTPALNEIFKEYKIEVLSPEEMAPLWTVRVFKANLNPWIQDFFTDEAAHLIIQVLL